MDELHSSGVMKNILILNQLINFVLLIKIILYGIV